MMVEDMSKADGEAHEESLGELLHITRKKSDVARGFNDTA